jgi:hypothetical protein
MVKRGNRLEARASPSFPLLNYASDVGVARDLRARAGAHLAHLMPSPAPVGRGPHSGERFQLHCRPPVDSQLLAVNRTRVGIGGVRLPETHQKQPPSLRSTFLQLRTR